VNFTILVTHSIFSVIFCFSDFVVVVVLVYCCRGSE